ncbi:hypothetical protein C8R47DRAFT_1134125 [Mycena vitilis]|nr:hypothetical protein C8R47DRAFT_1134125 [Mycena vitilis]
MLVSTLLIGTVSILGTGKWSSTSSCPQATAWGACSVTSFTSPQATTLCFPPSEPLPFRARCPSRLSALRSPDLVAPASVSPVKFHASSTLARKLEHSSCSCNSQTASRTLSCHLQDFQPSSSNFARSLSRPVKLLKRC